MRYLVTARLKPGKADHLERAIAAETLGEGSVAGDEYLRDMAHARSTDDGRVKWVETCFCLTPLAEERPYGGVTSFWSRSKMLTPAAAVGICQAKKPGRV